MTNQAADLESIPEVTLSDAQAERAYQLKARWERPNGQLLIPLTLTRYIVHLQDEIGRLSRPAHEREPPHCSTCSCALPVETSVALTKCPYCERPADSEGGINHRGGCIGLEKIDLSRLQYNALVSRAFAAETPADSADEEIGMAVRIVAQNCELSDLARRGKWLRDQLRAYGLQITRLHEKAGEKHDG